MEPSGPTSGIPPLLTRWQQTPAPALQVGQLLQATVLENRAGNILLALGHRQLSAESSLPFKPGQVLTLEVRSLGEQPVLKVIAALQESVTATAVRLLLPRYGATTPLLASLLRLAQAPAGALPPALPEAARTLLRQLPDRNALSSAQGVKTAIEQSGSFLERQLARAGNNLTSSAAIGSDFKASLLRLLAQLRNLAGGAQQAPGATAGRPTAAQAGVAPPPAPGAATQQTEDRTPAAATRTLVNDAGDLPRPATAVPQTVQRALAAAAATLPQRTVAATLTGSLSTASLPAATGTPSGGPAANTTGLNPPPPFAGVVPTPQMPVQASIDLLNSLGQLRLDLLQQTEAALARIHLNQLASLPREGEHRLVEWLFDIPVRRGEDVDLWSARLYRDAGGSAESPEQSLPLWSVQLAFDLPGLGPIQAQINLQGERVSTRFHAALPETLPLLQAHLHELRRSMVAVGLEVGAIDCRPGSIAAGETAAPDPLLNEHA